MKRHPHAAWHDVAQKLLPAPERVSPAKGTSSKGVCGLGTYDDTASERRARPRAMSLARRAAVSPVARCLDVIVGLAGKPDHEVQLESCEAAAERGPHGFLELGFVDTLVDGVAQRLGAGLGSQSDRTTLIGGEPREAVGGRVDAQRR